MIRVCVAGATGWVGRALVPALVSAPDLVLVGAVSRSAGGTALPIPGGAAEPVTVRATVQEALQIPADVLVDYTSPEAVKQNVLAAIQRGVHTVIGTSGLDEADFREIDGLAREKRVGVLAAGNFAISAVLLQHFATIAARHMPSWEIIDYAKATKPDAPSGTARELAARLAEVGSPEQVVPIEHVNGSPDSRGLTLHGTQVHSIRLPGYVIGAEVIFGGASELLSLRYDGGSGAEPYVAGTLLAIREVGKFVGLKRGLDQVLQLVSR